ncbi:putative phospholipid ABC transporter permease protein MlaE [bacterium BMS3Abin10]|nr:putative phospholipid ABC transporter permease protein MlaE [bacterium BMS3Abin10]GBE39883.1 putative phospholipid ABC transporter permease protein MlaE [bacterium BMS3Bbin08]HDH50871.1 ABC transporter permease [Nitrospirota bacterium]HDK41469.1 ABC transporter permease [Nitrospirota bacterium]
MEKILGYFEKLGDTALYYLDQTGRMGIFLFFSVASIFKPPYKISPIIKQVYIIGALSVSVILFTGAFTGMVLGLQGYHTLNKVGAEAWLGSMVALGLIRELGPVMAALMVTGRAGSAICAEIGIMRISEQIDALDCMAIDPHKFIIAPKFIAGVISLPLLTAIFDVVGIFGGYAVGVGLLGASEGAYFSSIYSNVEFADVYMGLVKPLCFGLLITWICSAKGYFVHLERNASFGAEGVSRATTNAVVLSSVCILVFDYILTSLLI